MAMRCFFIFLSFYVNGISFNSTLPQRERVAHITGSGVISSRPYQAVWKGTAQQSVLYTLHMFKQVYTYIITCSSYEESNFSYTMVSLTFTFTVQTSDRKTLGYSFNEVFDLVSVGQQCEVRHGHPLAPSFAINWKNHIDCPGRTAKQSFPYSLYSLYKFIVIW